MTSVDAWWGKYKGINLSKEALQYRNWNQQFHLWRLSHSYTCTCRQSWTGIRTCYRTICRGKKQNNQIPTSKGRLNTPLLNTFYTKENDVTIETNEVEPSTQTWNSFQDLSENEERCAEQSVKTQKVGGGTESGHHVCKFNSKTGEMTLMQPNTPCLWRYAYNTHRLDRRPSGTSQWVPSLLWADLLKLCWCEQLWQPVCGTDHHFFT